jgi:hypothetical protein
VKAIQHALEDPAIGVARVREVLAAELARGPAELHKRRSGYDDALVAAFGTSPAGDLVAALPVPATFRADAEAIEERAWRIAAGAVWALQQAVALPPPAQPQDLRLQAGSVGAGGDLLVLTLRTPGEPELAAMAFTEEVATVDRLRAEGVWVAEGVVDPHDLKAPIGPTHPLKVAEAIARLDGDPLRPDQQTEDAVMAVLQPQGPVARPHEDPDPARRVARRILQRLDGMGKWGGFHTEFVHLARGFAGNDRALAEEVGEALIGAELLLEKPSVGQRHVFLNPRRARDIRRFIEDGVAPVGLVLPHT